jgi:hypothetical protein
MLGEQWSLSSKQAHPNQTASTELEHSGKFHAREEDIFLLHDAGAQKTVRILCLEHSIVMHGIWKSTAFKRKRKASTTLRATRKALNERYCAKIWLNTLALIHGCTTAWNIDVGKYLEGDEGQYLCFAYSTPSRSLNRRELTSRRGELATGLRSKPDNAAPRLEASRLCTVGRRYQGRCAR